MKSRKKTDREERENERDAAHSTWAAVTTTGVTSGLLSCKMNT